MKYRPLFLPSALLISFLLGVLPQCQTTDPLISYGLQPAYEGYIPARIAVLACRPWPQPARFSEQALSNVSEEVVRKLCQEFDRQVLQAFAGQPFMKGFTPRLVQKLLDQAKKPDHLQALTRLWQHYPNDCDNCSSAPSVYHYSIAPSEKWRQWLHELSELTKFSDATLLPFVLYARERQYNDRGLLVSERRAAVSLFLIDTNNARLLWVGERQAVLTDQHLLSDGHQDYPAYPAWEDLWRRLFTDELWKEFPGKQWY